MSALGLAALANRAEQTRLVGGDPAADVALGATLLDRTVETARRGRPRGGRMGPEGRSWMARARAESARLRGVDDPRLWQETITEFGYGYRYEVARSRWRLAAALAGAGDQVGARSAAAAALTEATEMGARPLAGAILASRAARQARPAGHARLGRPADRPRGLAVLRLVAKGLTNRQVGEQLFISAKTVSVHMSNVLGKLGRPRAGRSRLGGAPTRAARGGKDRLTARCRHRLSATRVPGHRQLSAAEWSPRLLWTRRRPRRAPLVQDEPVADSSDALQQAIDELYAADPDEFMDRRGALSKAAKQSGDASAAKRIAALRKPTRSAYTVNRLARSDPDGIAELLDLGGQLRQAERSVDAGQIRELTNRRRRLVDDLVRRAFKAVDESSPSSALRDEVVSTLTAALADGDVAEQLAAGALVKPAKWEGFGFGGSPDLTIVPTPPARPLGPAKPAPVKGATKQERDEARQQAQAAEAERRATAKADAEQARQEAINDARRALDDAEEAVILATDEEQTKMDRLRLLEEQVTQARHDVDQARIQLRRAEIRQRRAEQALGRLDR